MGVKNKKFAIGTPVKICFFKIVKIKEAVSRTAVIAGYNSFLTAEHIIVKTQTFAFKAVLACLFSRLSENLGLHFFFQLLGFFLQRASAFPKIPLNELYHIAQGCPLIPLREMTDKPNKIMKCFTGEVGKKRIILRWYDGGTEKSCP